MRRRDFLTYVAVPAYSQQIPRSSPAPTGPRIRWQKKPGANVFEQVSCDGMPLVYRGGCGLLTASVANDGAKGKPAVFGLENEGGKVGVVEASFRHRLVNSGGGEDTLQAFLTLRNNGNEPLTLSVEFTTSAHPSRAYGTERAHLPLTANGMCHHAVLKSMGQEQLQDCDCFAGRPGENSGGLVAHYREPQESDPSTRTTRAPLLVPLVDVHHPDVSWRCALFASPMRPWRIAAFGGPRGGGGWSCGMRIRLGAGQEVTERCQLLLHEGGPEIAWRAFHRLAVRESSARPAWLDEALVHYYDFLGPGGPAGKRGLGWEQDAARFREFKVSIATQHGYYPFLGDYIHPDRKRWNAMASDSHGAFEMSIERIKERCKLARANGARAAVYLHTAGFDSASPVADKLREAALTGADGRPVAYAWQGPETVGALWHMSIASEAWRGHLLQQAQWIMELVGPDLFVIDETFGGLGYDDRPGHGGGMSSSMIEFLSGLRRIVRSFGPDKAVLTSDCSLANFVLWADGEGGDHAYSSLLGHELYRKPPVRYLAALGGRPWLPCAWQFTALWDAQMDLARKTSAGVGVSNGWIEYSGLTALPAKTKSKILRDLEEAKLLRAKRRP